MNLSEFYWCVLLCPFSLLHWISLRLKIIEKILNIFSCLVLSCHNFSPKLFILYILFVYPEQCPSRAFTENGKNVKQERQKKNSRGSKNFSIHIQSINLSVLHKSFSIDFGYLCWDFYVFFDYYDIVHMSVRPSVCTFVCPGTCSCLEWLNRTDGLMDVLATDFLYFEFDWHIFPHLVVPSSSFLSWHSFENNFVNEKKGNLL